MKHSILVIGVGSIGERHLRCFQNSGRAELSLCELNDSLRSTIAERYQIERAYADLAEAIADPPDAAVVCTPAHIHIPIARQLAEAGIHLLIEKPVSTSLEGVAELQQMIEQKSLSASIAYVYRAHPLMQEMREAVVSGRFGKPLEVTVVSGQHFPFYRPAYREIYYTKHETGGGAVQDALTHMVNAVEWIVGPVNRLVADLDHLALEGVEVEDTVHVLTRHTDVMGSFSLNQHQAANESTLKIVCERGTIKFELAKLRWSTCTEPGTDWTIENEITLERDDLFVKQAEMFLDTLEGLGPPACPLMEGAQTMQVNLAILESARRGSWQEVQRV